MTGPINFDDYRLCESLYFKDLEIGQKFPIL